MFRWMLIFSLLLFEICLSQIIYDKENNQLLQNHLLGSPRHTVFNINNISYWIGDDNFSGRNPLIGGPGVLYPRFTANIVWQDGIVWGGNVHDGTTPVLRVGGQVFRIGTVPGRIISPGVAQDPNDPDVRIYRIRRDWQTVPDSVLRLDAAELNAIDPSQVTPAQIATVRAQYGTDWTEWPTNYGAPFYDTNGNGIYEPQLGEEPGLQDADQVIWFVCNDLDLAATMNLYGSPPIGLELQVTFWGYDVPDLLGETIFRRYRLINKSGVLIDSMFIAQWSEIEIGNFGDDFVGCDSLIDLAYGYNGNYLDPIYSSFGLLPPAAGYTLLQGPIVPSPGDSAFFNFRYISGYRNLPMTSFGWRGSGTSIGSPNLGSYDGTLQWYNLLNGYLPIPDSLYQTPFLHGAGPNIGIPTFFPLDGDPYFRTGDIDGVMNNVAPGNREFDLATGPFTMQPGDTQEVVIALVAAQGNTHRHAVHVLKNHASQLQQTYETMKVIRRNISVNYPNNSQTNLRMTVNLSDFQQVQSALISFLPEYGTEPGFVVALYDDGSHNDSLPGDGIWGNETTNLNRQYPFRGDLQITTTSGIETFSNIYSGLQLRPAPVLKDFRVVWEDGLQDSSINNYEKVFLDMVVDNQDSINPIQEIAVNTQEKQNRVTITIPAGTALRIDSLQALLFAPSMGVSTTLDILVEFDYHLAQQTYRLPIQVWNPPSNWGDTLEVTSVVGAPNNVYPVVVDPGLVNGHNYEITFFLNPDTTSPIYHELQWKLRDLTTGSLLYNEGLPANDPLFQHPIFDGIQWIVRPSIRDFENFIVTANAAGPLDPPEQGCLAFNNSGFPLFMGSEYPDTTRQQTNGSAWGIHAGPGNDSSFSYFKARVARNDNWDRIIPDDYEIRFTAAGGQAQMAFTSNSIINVPFELWNIGIGNPATSSDDYRMIPWIFDEDNNDQFNLMPLDHVVSGADDDPYTDWIYFRNPTDTSAGDAGYQAVVSSGWTAGIGDEVIARLVLVNWNGGNVNDPGFPANVNATMPETGTTWRIITTKPNMDGDTLQIQAITNIDDQASIPLRYELCQNYPNPFNPVTTIRFSLVKTQPVKMEIFNILGQKVKTLVDWRMNAGGHEITWNSLNDAGSAVASGIYLYRLTAGDFVQTRKMILLK